MFYFTKDLQILLDIIIKVDQKYPYQRTESIS